MNKQHFTIASIAVTAITFVFLAAASAAEWQYMFRCTELRCNGAGTWGTQQHANNQGKFHELLTKGHRWTLLNRRIN